MPALSFVLAHWAELAPLAGALLVALARAVPPAFWSRHPRLGELARALRAAAPDLIKFARALAAVVRPAPPPADPPPPARLVVLPPAPKEPT